MSEELIGYNGPSLKYLKKFNVTTGDEIRVISEKYTYQGILMPRYELADNHHIVIKLSNGYNIGIKITPNLEIKRVGKGDIPTFISPPIPKGKTELPEVAIISTGGTIASRVDYRTGAVKSALSAKDLYSIFPELSDIARIKVKILYTLLSENIQPTHWSGIADEVADFIQEDVRGVVICHGTDTMGYTSAALSFALQDLPIPVVMVGSQRSSDRPSSDAYVNLVNSIYTAAYADFAEVVVCMHETISDDSTILLNAAKVRKLHTSRRDAFRSVNISPIARVKEGKITLLTDNYKQRDKSRNLNLKQNFDDRVALLKFYPGINPDILKWYLKEGYRAVIIEGTGLGHVGDYCLEEVKSVIEEGLIVCMSSQCLFGRVNMKVYDTGRDLISMGVIPLEDMLPETALVKMMWLLGSFQVKNVTDVAKLILTNFSGEINSRSEVYNYKDNINF